VIVENKLGAGGMIAAESVANARPDGSSLLITASNHSTGAAMRKSSPFDAIRDFSWISSLTTYGMVLAVGPNSRHKSLQDLLAFAKANPRVVSFSSVGVGTAHHLLGEWINAELGIELTHVPYKGSPLALTDLLGGQIDMMIDTATFVVPQSRQGKLKPLATTGPTRSSSLPELPTMIEAGFPGYISTAWFGIVAPAGTPKEIIARLNAEGQKVTKSPDFIKRMNELGYDIVGGSPEQMGAMIQEELKRWGPVVKTSGAQVD
jgi:tripartite-type tricarboxylate transporter receptor subunit TctC